MQIKNPCFFIKYDIQLNKIGGFIILRLVRGEIMSVSNKLGRWQKNVSIILGALLTGFMWRFRGSHGFGAFWGLVCVGSMITMLIFAFYGNRAKMKFELIPIGAVMTGITVPAWGAAVNMPGGRIESVALFTGETVERTGQTGQISGAVMMLMLGFGLVCLFGIYLGTLFSEKEYKIIHYLIFVAVFFAAAYLAKATFAHPVLHRLVPEVASGFEEGLRDRGIDLTPFKAYLSHFDNMAWAKRIPYGRYYYECVEHIAYCFASFILILTALIAFRDRLTAAVSAAVNVFAAVAITASDYFNICEFETSFLSSLSIPGFLRITSWSLWEFFTGFILGFGIMLVPALLPSEYSAGRKYRSEPYVDNKMLRLLLNFAAFEFVFIVVPVRALVLKLSRNGVEYNIIKDEDTISVIVIAAVSLVAAAVLFVIFKKNLYNKNLPVPFRMKPTEFAAKALGFYSLYYGAVYFFTGDASAVRLVSRAVKNSGVFPSILREGDFVSFIPVLAAFVMFNIIYFSVFKKLIKR